MARLTRLTLERDVKRVVRAGIRAARFQDGSRSVYAMPVLPDFYASHQWLRELRLWHPGPLVAVDFVINNDTDVLVGHYVGPEQLVTAAQARRTSSGGGQGRLRRATEGSPGGVGEGRKALRTAPERTRRSLGDARDPART